MKKYFIKSSGEEIVFGDSIELDFTKDLENGRTKHCHLEVDFYPEMIPFLLEEDIIEEKEASKNSSSEKSLLNLLKELVEKVNGLEKKVTSLESHKACCSSDGSRKKEK